MKYPCSRVILLVSFLSASPVIVSVTQSSHWDGEGLPRGVQSILITLCFVTDSEPTKKPNQKVILLKGLLWHLYSFLWKKMFEMNSNQIQRNINKSGYHQEQLMACMKSLVGFTTLPHSLCYQSSELTLMDHLDLYGVYIPSGNIYA